VHHTCIIIMRPLATLQDSCGIKPPAQPFSIAQTRPQYYKARHLLQVAASTAFQRATGAYAMATADFAAISDCVKAFQTATACRSNANMAVQNGSSERLGCMPLLHLLTVMTCDKPGHRIPACVRCICRPAFLLHLQPCHCCIHCVLHELSAYMHLVTGSIPGTSATGPSPSQVADSAANEANNCVGSG
jgi:hypothetical protein